MINPILQAALIFLSSLTVNPTTANSEPVSYEATYEISRGGKVMAEQTTTFHVEQPNQFTLTDSTIGTHGLASFTGFERNEKTHFHLDQGNITAVDHEMWQKVAFKKKTHTFNTSVNSDTIQGQGKKPFSIQSQLKPISSHLLAWWLSIQVCEGNQHIVVPVLKSNQIQTYEFNVFNESDGLLRVERIFPTNTPRSSQLWLDKKQHCLPVKTIHQEADDPVIESKLKAHHIIAKD